MIRPTKFMIDGIDRLGKSSLIKRIQDEFGYHMVIHYDKPLVLNNYLDLANQMKNLDENVKDLSLDNLAKYLYQYDTNANMFKLMETDIPIIFDRTHLGEMVYAPLYRRYSGDYVYELERQFLDSKPYTSDHNVRLILLTSSNTDMLVDDGLSFDPSKKNEEQNMFIAAFNRSAISNKVIIDVHDGKGGYKSYEEVFKEAMYKN